jgi:polyhydroxybutyrate depolymerase
MTRIDPDGGVGNSISRRPQFPFATVFVRFALGLLTVVSVTFPHREAPRLGALAVASGSVRPVFAAAHGLEQSAARAAMVRTTPAGPAPWGGPGATLDRGTFVSGKFAGRTWLSFAPDGVRRNAPLVVVLHGGGGSALSTATNYPLGRWQRVAQRRPGKMIVVYPDAEPGPAGRQNWNDCRPQQDGVQDVRFLAKLIKTLANQHRVDPRRVLVTGMSNGGMMTLRMAAQRPRLVSAAAPIAASMPRGRCGRPKGQVPIVLTHGTKDPLVPWAGGAVGFGGDRGEVRSVRKTVSIWTAANSAKRHANAHRFRDRSGTDGVAGTSSTVTRLKHPQKGNGAMVVLLRVTGGGHTVPDRRIADPLPARLVGAQNRDINAVSVIWRMLGWPS